jgi:hypothetical protein
MDTDNDWMVTFEDIKNFALKHEVFYSDEVFY